MKKIAVFVILVSTCITVFAGAEKKSTSKIKHVNVYLNKAEIDRSSIVSIPSGNVDVVLTGLSQNIDPNSIRLSGSGDASIMSVQFRKNFVNKNQKSSEVIKLEGLIESKQDEITLNANSVKILNEELDLFNKNKSIGGANNGVNWENLENVADLFRERLKDIHGRLFTLNKTKIKINKEISDLRNQLNTINKNRNKPSGEIIVKVYSKKEQTINMKFSYLVNNAGWTPNYDIKAEDGSEKVNIVFKANVFQSTGIDWSNVPLSISTNNPAQGGVKPNLYPWYVNIYQNYQKKSYKSGARNAAPAMQKQSLVAYDDAEVQEEVSMDYAAVEVSQTQLATKYEVQLKQDVPSDGQYHIVRIDDYDVNAYLEHAAVPKLDKDAFLLAHLTDWEQFDFISGEANVFFDGTYVGNTFFNTQSAADTMQISLGRDQKVVIKREKIKDFCKVKSFGLNIKKQLGYEIVIKNNKSSDIKLNLQDQLPISQNEQIVVTAIEIDGAKQDLARGFLDWDLKIKSGASKKVTLKFEVKYPKKINVSGL